MSDAAVEQKAKKEPISNNETHCMKCNKRVEVKDASTDHRQFSKKTRKGKIVESRKTLLKGTCPHCGNKTSRFIKDVTEQAAAKEQAISE